MVDVPVVVAPSVEEVPVVEEAPVAVPVVAGQPGAFHLAAYRDGPLGLFPMRNDVVLVGAQALAEAGPDQDLTQRPGMTRGFHDLKMMMDSDWIPLSVGGRWPDSAHLSGYFIGHRFTSPVEVYAWKESRWQRKKNIEGLVQWHYGAFAPWTDGQTLALRVTAIDARALESYEGEPPPAVARRHAAALAAAPPRFVVLDAKPGAAAPPAFPAGLTAQTFTTRASGEIDAIVTDAANAAILLRWLPGAAQAERFPLPPSAETPGPMTLLAHGDGSLWVGATLGQQGSYLARFDGAAWTVKKAPGEQSLRALSVGSDGLLWAVTAPERYAWDGASSRAGVLWRSADGATWQAHKLPALRFPDLAEKRYERAADETDYRALYGDAEAAKQRRPVLPLGVWSRGAGDVWVLGVANIGARMDDDNYLREVVLRTRVVERPLALLSNEAQRLEMLDEVPVKPMVFPTEEICDPFMRVTVFMRLPADAPQTGPVPQVEAMLAAHPELAGEIVEIWEARHRGRRVAAFMVDGMRDEAAPKVLAALAEVVPEERSFACRQAIPVRPLYTAEAMTARAQAYAATQPGKP